MNKKDEKQHVVVQLNDSYIRILIPDGYMRLKYKNPLEEMKQQVKNERAAFQKFTSNCNAIVDFAKLEEDKCLPSNEKDLIDGIHYYLGEDQGLIEVGTGYTKKGYRYVYSIVKNLNREVRGVIYFLRLQLFFEEMQSDKFDAIDVAGEFTEINTTGMRDSIGLDFARRAELIDFSKENIFEGWNEDPYDPEYRKGALMNLSERAGLDGIFPDHPLSQCREFLKAVLNNQLVIIKKESDGNEENKEKQSEKEFLLMMFENKADRHTYNVDVSGKEPSTSFH